MKKEHNEAKNKINSISNSTFSAAMLEADGYNRWIVNYHSSYLTSPLLEIGLGHGAFYDYLPHNITNYVGLDIDSKLVQHAQKLYPGNKYLCNDLASDTFSADISQKFNTIICFNVLEHIDNHEKALKNMLDVLSPQGYILLFVPAFQSLYTDMDHLAGHFRRYKISHLKELAKQCGGEIVEYSYFNFLGGIGWWVNRFFKHQTLNDDSINHQIRFFNKIILPLSKIIQPLTKKIFGQSLYVVLKKGSL